MWALSIVVGWVGVEGTLRRTGDGRAVTDLKIVVRSFREVNGKRIEIGEWYTVVFYGRLAEIAVKHGKKSRLVLVQGIPKTRQWQTREGVTKYRQEIQAEVFRILLWNPPAQHELRDDAQDPHFRSEAKSSDRRLDDAEDIAD